MTSPPAVERPFRNSNDNSVDARIRKVSARIRLVGIRKYVDDADDDDDGDESTSILEGNASTSIMFAPKTKPNIHQNLPVGRTEFTTLPHSTESLFTLPLPL